MSHMQISPGGRGIQTFAERLTVSVLKPTVAALKLLTHKVDLHKHTVLVFYGI